MSAPFKFKLKVKAGPEATAAPSTSQRAQPGAAQPQDQFRAAAGPQWPPIDQTPSQPLQPVPSKPFKFKLKVGNSSTQAPAPPVEQQAAQHWDATQAAAVPPPVWVKREAPEPGPEAGAAPAPRPIKKIKLSTCKPTGVPMGKKPIIKFKPPPKQPRTAVVAATIDAAAAAEPMARTATLPIVRLTLPAVGGFGGGAGGGVKWPKAKSLNPGFKAAAGGAKKNKVKTAGKAKAGGIAVDSGGKRPKRSRSEMKELRDLGIDDLEGYDPGAPIAPRTFTLRSSHAKAADTAPSSTGLGLSMGAPAPSDARTGASGGAAMADTAGTEAQEEAVFASRPLSAQGPAGPPKREDFERLLARCQKKDVHSMFKEPVTEAIAPGYFSVIKRPMDFSAMRTKAQRGEYGSWEVLRADMRLMFTNALTYNAQGGTMHNYAKLLMGQCDRIVELAMQGKTDFRSSATITRKHNAEVKARQRAEREQLRAKARAEQRAAQEAKVLKKAGLESSYEEHDDENIRNSYRRPVRDPNVARWKGLGAGSSTEGVAWGPGREVLRPTNPWLPPGMYALSLARFAAGLKGRARELVLRRALASTAADEAAERALQLELAKKVPPPPPPMPPAAVAVAATAASAAGARQGGMVQQPTATQAVLGAATVAAGSAAAVAAAPANMLTQQQLMMQAAVGRPPGMQGMIQPAPGQLPGGLPPGATITLMATPQGMVPFLIRPGQRPMMMMAPGMQPGMQFGGPGTKPGMTLQPGFQPNFMHPGMQPRQ